MEIIKNGTRGKDIQYESKCKSCGCVFRYKEGEAKLVHDSRDGNYLDISCPCCGCSVTKSVAIRDRSF